MTGNFLRRSYPGQVQRVRLNPSLDAHVAHAVFHMLINTVKYLLLLSELTNPTINFNKSLENDFLTPK